MDFEEEGIYIYCDRGYTFRMMFTPENEDDCYVNLIGDSRSQQVYGVSSTCNDNYESDNYESEAVQMFFEHFGITVSEDRKRRHK